MKWHLMRKRCCLIANVKGEWGTSCISLPGIPFTSCPSTILLEIKEQDPCLESQGIHPAAEPVVRGHVSAPYNNSWSINKHQSVLGEEGLIEPSGRQVALLSADDMIRTSQRKYRCVPGGAHHLAWSQTIIQLWNIFRYWQMENRLYYYLFLREIV